MATGDEKIVQMSQDIDRLQAFTSDPVGYTDANGVARESIPHMLARLEDTLISAGTLLAKQTLAALNADLAHDENTLAYVTNDATVANNGYYIKVGASGAGSWLHEVGEGFEERISDVWEKAGYSAGSVDVLKSESYKRESVYPTSLTVGTGWAYASGLKGYVYGFAVDSFDTVDRFRLRLDGVDAAARLHARLFMRSQLSSYTGAPSLGDGDILIDEWDHDTSTLPASPTGVTVIVDLDRTIFCRPDNYYLLEVVAYDGSDVVVALGSRSSTIASDAVQALKGYSANSSSVWSAITTASTAACIEVFSVRAAGFGRAIESLQQSSAVIAASLGDNHTPISTDALSSNSTTSRFAATLYSAYGVFREVTSDTYVRSVRFDLNLRTSTPVYNETDTTVARVRVYEGPQTMTKSDYDFTDPIVDISVSVTLSDNSDTPVYFTIDRMFYEGKRYAIILSGYDADGNYSGIGCSLTSLTGLGSPFDGMFKSTPIIPWTYSGAYAIKAVLNGYVPQVSAETIDGLMSSMAEQTVIVNDRTLAGGSWDTGFDGWAVGYNPERRVIAGTVTLWLSNVLTNTDLLLKVIRRPLVDGQGAPGALNRDETIFQQTYDVDELGVLTNDLAPVQFDVSSLGLLDPTYIYFWMIQAVGGQIGSGAAMSNLGPTDYWQRGYCSTTSSAAFTALTSPYAIAWEFSGSVLTVVQETAADYLLPTPVLDTEPTASGLVISIPAFTISQSSGDVDVDSGTLTLDAPTSVSVVNADYTLKYDLNVIMDLNSNAPLPYRYVRNMTVVRASDSVQLTGGIDYTDNLFDGALVSGLINTLDIPVKLTYTGYSSRYDLIEVDPFTGTLSVVKGTDRVYDPEEYIPAPTAGKIPVCMAYVYADSVQVIPLYDWFGGVKAGTEVEQAKLAAHNASCLSGVLGKLRSGGDINLAGYGDSITAQGSGVWDTANGVTRDVVTYFADIPSDTKATWTLYDHSDGGGSIHTHFGWNFILKSHLETLFGGTVTYYNYGLGGTDSANYIDGVLRGGSEPGRLAAMLSCNPDLVVIAFGMNEIGQSDTTNNMVTIIEACKAAGADVIVLGCPRPSYLGWSRTAAALKLWMQTNDRLWLAARHAGAAFVSTTYFEGDDGFGSDGISPHSYCTANRYNHPGPAQLATIGQFLCSLFR